MQRPANIRHPRHFNRDKTDDEVTTKHERLEKNNNNNFICTVESKVKLRLWCFRQQRNTMN